MIDREIPCRGKGREGTSVSDGLGPETGREWLVREASCEYVCPHITDKLILTNHGSDYSDQSQISLF